ncbi:glycosyltransferase [Rhizosaccharibacter radicis]|uniref:Glycosyltransferase n=1 Tax=Rhizosaccharibacter radicis TaxID=2782605 RepID=A0ABT1VY14_9PROT|nr:glycosyltransferase [Acetobacteraceae bacterium KSS12]
MGDTTWRSAPTEAERAFIALVLRPASYHRLHPDVAAAGGDPLEHFLTAGLREGRSPTPLFDPAFYRARAKLPPDMPDLFLHFLRIGAAAGHDPHPLVDLGFLRRCEPGGPPFRYLACLLDEEPGADIAPNSFFDPRFYRERVGIQRGSLLLHYVEEGWRAGIPPHPLFDPAHYRQQRPDVAAAGLDPLSHFRVSGAAEGVSPHPMVAAPDRLHPNGELCPFFDPDFYRLRNADVSREGLDPLLHFLSDGIREERDPHPLFDTAFYRRHHPDVEASGVPPFLHYVKYGSREPNRDPNSFFDTARFLAQVPEAADHRWGPLGYYLDHPEAQRLTLSSGFDPSYYLAVNPDVASHRTGPLSHFLFKGRSEGRGPCPRRLQDHPWRGPAGDAVTVASAPRAGGRPILLVSHEASRSGAVLCALNAAKAINAASPGRCRVLLFQDGPMRPGFESVADTVALPVGIPHPARLSALADLLFSFIRDMPDGIVVLNTAAMRDAVPIVSALKIRPVVWLHEMPISLDAALGGADTIRMLAGSASAMITVSVVARDALCAHYDLPRDRLNVIPNGVTPPQVAVSSREHWHGLRTELRLPPDALVVVGCGQVEFRKGTDLFIKVAQRVIARSVSAPDHSALRQACFLWIGPMPDRFFGALCQHDIERAGLDRRVRLLGEQEDVGRFLSAADLFLTTSREEAYGLAGMEAALAGLRVISFEGCGNAESLAASGRLIQVPYGDTDAMAAAVLDHGDRPARRTHRLPPWQGDLPSWATWLQQFDRLLERPSSFPLGGDSILLPASTTGSARGGRLALVQEDGKPPMLPAATAIPATLPRAGRAALARRLRAPAP